MAALGSPCGACKFLRRKCVRGCVFAPYFCHEQGATHFAAIHKIFGASNVSKLLMHLPAQDRLDAAVTISYEAQARLQDPIYGCISHIFALQQQVINLQAQLASLKALEAQTLVSSQEERPYRKLGVADGFVPSENPRTVLSPPLVGLHGSVESLSYNDDGFVNPNSLGNYYHSTMREVQVSVSVDDEASRSRASSYMQLDSRKWELIHDMEDLQSVAFGYLHHT